MPLIVDARKLNRKSTKLQPACIKRCKANILKSNSFKYFRNVDGTFIDVWYLKKKKRLGIKKQFVILFISYVLFLIEYKW